MSCFARLRKSEESAEGCAELEEARKGRKSELARGLGVCLSLWTQSSPPPHRNEDDSVQGVWTAPNSGARRRQWLAKLDKNHWVGVIVSQVTENHSVWIWASVRGRRGQQFPGQFPRTCGRTALHDTLEAQDLNSSQLSSEPLRLAHGWTCGGASRWR